MIGRIKRIRKRKKKTTQSTTSNQREGIGGRKTRKKERERRERERERSASNPSEIVPEKYESVDQLTWQIIPEMTRLQSNQVLSLAIDLHNGGNLANCGPGGWGGEEKVEVGSRGFSSTWLDFLSPFPAFFFLSPSVSRVPFAFLSLLFFFSFLVPTFTTPPYSFRTIDRPRSTHYRSSSRSSILSVLHGPGFSTTGG